MAFSSMTFLFGFLPAVLLCYFVIPARFRAARNFVLLAFSLVFYCWGGIALLPVFLVSCLLNWGRHCCWTAWDSTAKWCISLRWC